MALVRSLVIFAALLVIATGCDSNPGPSLTPAGFADAVQSALDDARGSGASAEQIEILERVMLAGSVAHADVEDAVSATLRCFERAGVRYDVLPDRVDNGITFPSYAFEGGDKTAIADECIHANSDYVETLYATQPAAVEAGDKAFEAAMPAIIACLRDLGVEVDPNVTPDELKERLVLQADELGTPLEKEAHKRVQCAVDAGLTSGF